MADRDPISDIYETHLILWRALVRTLIKANAIRPYELADSIEGILEGLGDDASQLLKDAAQEAKELIMAGTERTPEIDPSTRETIDRIATR